MSTPCRLDPELWFSNEAADKREAKRLCHTCPVQAQCLNEALDSNQRFGIWGGEDMTNYRLRRRVPADATKTCAHCGDAFWPHRRESRTDWGLRRFCSRGCANRSSHAKRVAGKESAA
jgi:hypothetical protein